MKVLEAYELNNGELSQIKIGSFINGTFEHPLVNVYDIPNAKILGFGGAFTEASAYNYSLLCKEDKNKVLELLFGKTGLKYNLCRICIGSSDFFLDEYCYVNNDDYDLKSFTIEKDKKYIIPFIRDAIKYCDEEIVFLASPWSPPSFMKTNNDRLCGGKLKKDCYKAYSKYICKFIKEYKKEGIEISYLTLQNEPKATQTWESCVFDANEEIAFAKVFKSIARKENVNVKLLAWDHNKERLVERAGTCLKQSKLFDGSAYHWYSGNHFDAISILRTLYPDKLILETEFCKSSSVDYTTENYSNEFLGSIKSGTNGLIEWNLITDENGGPYHDRKGGCLAPITLLKNGQFVQSKNYYQSWIYSHFIERNSFSLKTSSYSDNVKISAVKNYDNSYIINIINNDKDEEVKLYFKGKFLPIKIKKNCSYVLKIK